MAIEVRPLQFLMDQDNYENVDPGTFNVPVDRTYLGAVTGQNGPALMVQGDWSNVESVSYAWHRRQDLPWIPSAGGTGVGVWFDQGWGFSGIVVEGA